MSTLPGSFDQEAETGETADSMAARFDKDWHRAERRFGVVSGYRNFRCDLADETGQAATTPHEGIPDALERWKPLRTRWERRDLFSHSPHFRLHCAYRLVRTGQAVEALSRLIAIVNEWPWLREAHLNLLQVLNHLDPGRVTLEPELRQQVEQRIRDNGWTTDGMQSLEVRPLTTGN